MKKTNTLFLAIIIVFGLLTFVSCKKKEGMDLKVTLKTSPKEMLNKLSYDVTDTAFVETIRIADSLSAVDTSNYFSLFAKAWGQLYPQERFTHIFYIQLKDKISQNSSNEEALAAIRAQYKDAISKTAEVLRGRLDDYDLYEYEVTLSDTIGLIHLELEGVKDTARIIKLIQACGNLEFWETYEYKDVYSYFNQADALLKAIFDKASSVKSKDSTDSFTENEQGNATSSDSIGDKQSEQEKVAKEHPLYSKLKANLVKDEKGKFYSPAKGPVVGFCKIKDTARVNYLMNIPVVKKLFPIDVRFAWTVRPDKDKKNMLELLALKVSQRDGSAPINGTVVTDAKREKGENGIDEILITMNDEGARLWGLMTEANIGKSIAMLVDGYVYTYPTVQAKITEGKSKITGNFTTEEATDLALILKASMMPLSVSVVKITVTGTTAEK
jgi:SecD/SecF fusion protein